MRIIGSKREVTLIDEKDLLVEGEEILGRYTIVLLQEASNGAWLPSVMQLDAMITNYRLLLRPFRKKYDPASLPAHYITRIDMTVRDKYHVVELQLVTKHFLCLMLSTGKLNDLYRDVCAMKRPTRFVFDDKLARADIERLITYFGKQPLPDTAS